MIFGYNDTCLQHDPGGRHPERPDRLRAIKEGLDRKHGVEFAAPDPATRDQVMTVHDPAYVDSIASFCNEGGGSWDLDTVAGDGTWDAALASAGLARWAATHALTNAGRDTPFALCRPPGHHALSDNAMGFCFFNNIAIAAQYVLNTTPVDRVAILDWDVHHGNGTQEIFYPRSDVLYISIHEEDLYPGTGHIDETGTNDGVGTTCNVPLPPGTNDPGYRAVIDQLISPLIEVYDPGLLLVSAGFDGHRHDPISRMHLSTEGYGFLTTRVRDLSQTVDAGLGFILEGGYSLEQLAESVGMVHDTIDGYQPVTPDPTSDDAVNERITTLCDIHGLGSK